MIFTRWTDNEVWYHVCNDYGDCLIHTRSSQLAHYIDQCSRGLERGYYITIGGDRPSKRNRHPEQPNLHRKPPR